MFVKICGITSEEDALVAVAMGADALGFNFVSGSVRQIRPAVARDIVRRLPGGILSVGIFRNHPVKEVIDTVHEVGLGAAQLHGNETPEDSRTIAVSVPSVIKVFVAGDDRMDRATEYGAEIMLVDAPVGGSGEVFDWKLLDGRDRGLPLLLAGGLTPENVAAAVRQVRPWGVDVASGVESAPGVKDPTKMMEFIRNAKEAAPSDEYEPAPDAAPVYDWRDE